MRLNRQVAVWLGCAALLGGVVAAAATATTQVAAVQQQQQRQRDGLDDRREGHRRRLDGQRQGRRHRLHGQGHRRGDVTAGIKDFNAQNNGVTVKLLEFSTSADEQRAQFVQRQEAKSGECDVFSSDVDLDGGVRLAEVALRHDAVRRDARRPSSSRRRSRPSPTTARSGACRSRPTRRSSTTAPTRSRTLPTTWQDVYAQAKANDGIVYQGAPYEGLTCDFLELAFAAGGKVLSDDGKKAEIDSPENLKALQFMVDGVKDGTAANGVTTYMEEESRRYFESGKATFMRNWPYAYALGEKAPGGQGQVQRHAVPAVRGRRQGRHPRRPQPGHLGLLEEPGRRR